MDAILFSVNPKAADVNDAITHLKNHRELYWTVGFSIRGDKFTYPILGYMYICRGQVEYVSTIQEIKPFSPSHYKDKEVKPEKWRIEYEQNPDSNSHPRRQNTFVMTHIERRYYNIGDFRKFHEGGPVKRPTQSYIRVLEPREHSQGPMQESAQEASLTPVNQQQPLSERNLEDFVLQQLEEIEPGLKLIARQLSTPAGRLDILCQDRLGWYVVVELKRDQGTDRVVGQIQRYMGWAKENYRTDNVRGIIIVGKKDNVMSYALKAASNIQVKEFKVSIIE